MSFRLQPTPVARPNRCQLFGPGSNVKLFEKMAASAADVVNLDLEDSVAPTDKDAAPCQCHQSDQRCGLGHQDCQRPDQRIGHALIGTATWST